MNHLPGIVYAFAGLGILALLGGIWLAIAAMRGWDDNEWWRER